MNIHPGEIYKSFLYAARFIPVTLYITLVPLLLCIVVGGIIAVLRVYRIPVLSSILDFLISILKGIPAVLFLVATSLLFATRFDSLAKLLHLGIRARDVDAVYLAIFVLTVTSIPSLSESFRGALLSVPRGQYEAGYSVGMTKVQTFFRIILPQAFFVILPSLTNNTIGLLKGSSLVYMIGVTDILNSALKPANATYAFLESYIAAAIIYWILCAGIELIGKGLEVYFGKYKRGAAL
jgi:L-cystine transport system permease protein